MNASANPDTIHKESCGIQRYTTSESIWVDIDSSLRIYGIKKPLGIRKTERHDEVSYNYILTHYKYAQLLSLQFFKVCRVSMSDLIH